MGLEVRDYIKVFKKRLALILTIVCLSCGIAALYDYLYSDPLYEASTKLVVNNSGGIAPDSNAINSNIMLIQTYKEIIATRAIMEKVKADNPQFHMDVQKMIEEVKVKSSTGSQVMSIAIRDSSREQAVRLVNAISDVFKREIPLIMNVDNVTILSYAEMNNQSSLVSSGLILKLSLVFALSLLLSLGLAFFLEYLDDTLKDDKDVRDVLNLPTIAVIAKIERKDLPGSASKTHKVKVGDSINVGINQ
ncbi:YveK family protein [Cohnella sp. GCM10027633]|uniref:YveK family protein n=1 Tax=unclassified Cohnella TaxID=2636738 RepID=UPI003626818A